MFWQPCAFVADAAAQICTQGLPVLDYLENQSTLNPYSVVYDDDVLEDLFRDDTFQCLQSERPDPFDQCPLFDNRISIDDRPKLQVVHTVVWTARQVAEDAMRLSETFAMLLQTQDVARYRQERERLEMELRRNAPLKRTVVRQVVKTRKVPRQTKLSTINDYDTDLEDDFFTNLLDEVRLPTFYLEEYTDVEEDEENWTEETLEEYVQSNMPTTRPPLWPRHRELVGLDLDPFTGQPRLTGLVGFISLPVQQRWGFLQLNTPQCSLQDLQVVAMDELYRRRKSRFTSTHLGALSDGPETVPSLPVAVDTDHSKIVTHVTRMARVAREVRDWSPSKQESILLEEYSVTEEVEETVIPEAKTATLNEESLEEEFDESLFEADFGDSRVLAHEEFEDAVEETAGDAGLQGEAWEQEFECTDELFEQEFENAIEGAAAAEFRFEGAAWDELNDEDIELIREHMSVRSAIADGFDWEELDDEDVQALLSQRRSSATEEVIAAEEEADAVPDIVVTEKEYVETESTLSMTQSFSSLSLDTVTLEGQEEEELLVEVDEVSSVRSFTTAVEAHSIDDMYEEDSIGGLFNLNQEELSLLEESSIRSSSPSLPVAADEADEEDWLSGLFDLNQEDSEEEEETLSPAPIHQRPYQATLDRLKRPYVRPSVRGASIGIDRHDSHSRRLSSLDALRSHVLTQEAEADHRDEFLDDEDIHVLREGCDWGVTGSLEDYESKIVDEVEDLWHRWGDPYDSDGLADAELQLLDEANALDPYRDDPSSAEPPPPEKRAGLEKESSLYPTSVKYKWRLNLR